MKRIIKASQINPQEMIAFLQKENAIDTIADHINNDSMFEVETLDNFKWMVHDQVSRWLKEEFNFIGEIPNEVIQYIDSELSEYEPVD